MLKQLYQLQELETAQRALNEERLASPEYQRLRVIKAAFEQEKEGWQQLSAAIGKLEAKLSAAQNRVRDLGEKLSAERQAVYDG